MQTKIKQDLLKIVLFWLSINFIFLFFVKYQKGSLENVYKAWDGPSYVIAAMSQYIPERAVQLNSIHSPEIRNDFTFLPAHFPLYPTLIRTFAFIGPYQAMLMISLLGSLGFLISLYFLALSLRLKNPLIWAATATLLPPRFFIISHTGSSEPLFLMWMVLSLVFYFKNKTLSSSIFASLALATRPQGALLGLGYLLVAIYQFFLSKNKKQTVGKFTPYILIPITLLAIFGYYQRQTGDFFAFFHAISIFHHFSAGLFPSFHMGALNIETFWQEENVIYFLFYLYAIIRLARGRQVALAIISTVFYLPLLFLQHNDISRYSLSLMPYAWVAYHELFSKKSFLYASILILPAIIMYGSDFIQNNRAP